MAVQTWLHIKFKSNRWKNWK